MGNESPLGVYERLIIYYSSLRGKMELGRLRGLGLADIKLLLPTIQDAAAAWSSICSWGQGLGEENTTYPELSNEALARQRWRNEPKDMFKYLGPDVGRVWTLYWDILPAEARRQMFLDLRDAGFFKHLKPSDSLALLKKISGAAKKYREMLFGDKWKFYVDIDMLRDYDKITPESENEFIKTVYDWVAGPQPKHAFYGSEALFLKSFEAGVNDFLSRAPRTAEFTPLTIKQFSADPAFWARSGTSTGDRLELVVDGKVRKARKSKWATALAASPESIAARIRRDTQMSNVVIGKRERKKVRPVIAGDLDLYLKMAYVSHVLDPLLAGHPNSTLFMSGSQQYDLWVRMAQMTSDDTVKMPIDQEEFDHQATIRFLDICDKAITKLIKTVALPWDVRMDLLYVMRLITKNRRSGPVRVFNRIFMYTKGVLSGWAWTALYDTLINWGELYAIRKHVAEKTGFEPIMEGTNVQGDDVMPQLVNYSSAVLVWAGYKEADFKVNPYKFWIATNSHEYLRQVAQPGRIGGYPARTVPALVWRNPVSREELRGEERIRELTTSWLQAYSRAETLDVPRMANDIAKSMKLEPSVITSILESPACVGGTGTIWNPDRTTWYGINKARLNYKFTLNRIPPFLKEMTMNGGPQFDMKLALRDMKDLVEPPPKTEYDVEPFEIKEWVPFSPVFLPGMISLTRGANVLEPRYPPNLLPTQAKLARATGIERKDRTLIRSTIRLDDLPLEEQLWNKAARRTYYEWVGGRLPFSTPVVPGWSPLAVSYWYSKLATMFWAWASSRRHVYDRTVRRAALAAELHVSELLGRLPVRVFG